MAVNFVKPDTTRATRCPPCPADAAWFDRCIYLLGIGFGSGQPVRAPGTWGSLGGLLAALPMMVWGFWPFFWLTAAACAAGSYICGRTAQLMCRHDDPHIVWDEWVGLWLALLPVAWMSGGRPDTAIGLTVAGFLLFRLFDILKPPPIRAVDRQVAGGLGILLDDVLAGLMSGALLLVLRYIFGLF